MLSQKYQGSSLFEVIVALCIFSLSVTVISSQVEMTLRSMNAAQKHVMEVYHHGV